MYESVNPYESPSCYPLPILERFTRSHIHMRLPASGRMQSTRPHGHGRIALLPRRLGSLAWPLFPPTLEIHWFSISRHDAYECVNVWICKKALATTRFRFTAITTPAPRKIKLVKERQGLLSA